MKRMTTDFPLRSIEPAALDAYSQSLDRIRWDLLKADSAMSGSSIDYADLIHAAAHLRLVIENTVFASLFANRTLLLEAELNLNAKRDMGDTRKVIRKVNPNYWPRGMRLSSAGGSDVALEPHPDALQEEEYSKAWGKLSSVLHGRNPYLQPKMDPDEVLRFERQLAGQLHATLDYHFIDLPCGEILYARTTENPVKIQMLKVG